MLTLKMLDYNNRLKIVVIDAIIPNESIPYHKTLNNDLPNNR